MRFNDMNSAPSPAREDEFLVGDIVLPGDYEPLMSDYLISGRREERWVINWMRWDGDTLRASCRLDGAYVSKTDGNRSHLSVYAAREMDAQLGIILMHLKMGSSQKTSEVWLLKGGESCKAPIKDLTDVRFEKTMSLRSTSSGKLLTTSHASITDRTGGLIMTEAVCVIKNQES